MKTPVVLIVFNRPDTTARVMEAIRRARPEQLFLIADGSRPGRNEEERCAEVRKIVQLVDWPCTVHKDFADQNLGCKLRVASGLDWVFNAVEEAIILEDDCLPEPSFFPYCEELLERFRLDERVGMISGDNFQFGVRRSEFSYYFTRYSHIWGWATWRRAWKRYDVEMKLWPLVRDGNWLEDIFAIPRLVSYWRDCFQKVYDGEVDTWDTQWVFCNLINGRLGVMPQANLVSNIGFGEGATHTQSVNQMAEIPVEPMGFPLKHPELMVRDALADHRTDLLHLPPTRWERKVRKFKRLQAKLLRLVMAQPPSPPR